MSTSLQGCTAAHCNGLQGDCRCGHARTAGCRPPRLQTATTYRGAVQWQWQWPRVTAREVRCREAADHRQRTQPNSTTPRLTPSPELALRTLGARTPRATVIRSVSPGALR